MLSAEQLRSPGFVGIIGYPLENTGSPTIHNTAFELCRIPWHYVPFRIRPPRLAQALQALKELGILGFNVTAPYKLAIKEHLVSLSPEARAIGAVNTVTVERSRWRGHNTDAYGFTAALGRHRRRLRGAPALLFGTGGAARAVAHALICDLGVGALQVVTRNPVRAAAFVRWADGLDARVPVSAEALRRPGDWGPAFREAIIVVQATSAEVAPRRRRTLLPARLKLAQGQIAYDLVYGRVTPFLEHARRADATTIDGQAMLWAQAARSFELWTKRRFPLSRVRRLVSTF
jgi:shikimate dehydrogenase